MAINFRAATDELLACITHRELADVLGVSVATIRQARLDESAKAHRRAPDEWPARVAKLAKARADKLERLAEMLSH